MQILEEYAISHHRPRRHCMRQNGYFTGLCDQTMYDPAHSELDSIMKPFMTLITFSFAA